MKLRQAVKILKSIELYQRTRYHPQGKVDEAFGILSKHPSIVEPIACKPHWVLFCGKRHFIKPELVRHRFGDGRLWGTLSPLNTRPNYYLFFGDSSWISGRRNSNDDKFRDALDAEIYLAIADQFGDDSFYCEICGGCNWEEKNECCASERDWPALNTEGSCWSVPCYTTYYRTFKSLRTNHKRKSKRKRRGKFNQPH